MRSAEFTHERAAGGRNVPLLPECQGRCFRVRLLVALHDPVLALQLCELRLELICTRTGNGQARTKDRTLRQAARVPQGPNPSRLTLRPADPELATQRPPSLRKVQQAPPPAVRPRAD
eukprot:COSAG02_NODE_3184_length_7215_cov_12.871417_6_plen_118_part_00